MKQVAWTLSFIFHPLLLPSAAFGILFYAHPQLFGAYSETEIRQMFLIVIINTILFPAVSVLLMWGVKVIQSPFADTRQERILPFIVTGLFYVWAFVVFRRSGFPSILSTILLGACITLFVTFFVNLFRKVSIHAGAISAMIVIVLYASFQFNPQLTWLLLITVLIAGVVGSSRMLLNAHDTTEIFAGYFIGFVGQLIAFKF